jgi:hypothetical protein
LRRHADGSGFAWTLLAPEAFLFDRAGRKIGSHYAGPTWETFDGSKVGGGEGARRRARRQGDSVAAACCDFERR